MTIKKILVVAPHPDDETLGVGGTIAKLASEGHEVNVLIVSGHLPPLYKREDYERSANEAHQALDVLGVLNSKFLEIPATMIGDMPLNKLNKSIFEMIGNVKPHMVFCPFPDRHIDHRLVFDSVMVATRPVGVGKKIEIVAAYETLSETHWNAPYIEPNFSPNLVIDVSNYLSKKIEALKCYESQISFDEGPRSIKAISALAQFRGSQSGFEFGEAFYVIRMTL